MKDGETGFFSSRSHQWIRDPSGTLAPSCGEPLDLGGRAQVARICLDNLKGIERIIDVDQVLAHVCSVFTALRAGT